jgi:hypothetical protein
MYPDEVVPSIMNRQRGDVLLDLFRVRVSQSSEPPHLHPHCEILALNIACADVFWIWVADNPLHLAADALRRAVANSVARFLYRSAVLFNQHSIVDVLVKRAVDCLKIEPISVRRQLDPIRQSMLKIVDESPSRVGIATAHPPCANQLGISIHRYPRPNVPRMRVSFQRLWRDILLLRRDECPNLIALDAITGQIYECLVQESGARSPEIENQLTDCVSGHPCHAFNGSNRVTFDERGYDPRPRLSIKPIHTSIIQRSSIVSISKICKSRVYEYFYFRQYLKCQFGLGLLGPAGFGRFSRDLRALLGSQGSSASRAAFQSAKASQLDSGGVLGFNCGRFSLGPFANGLKKDLVGKLIRVARPFAGPVRHDAFSMTGRGLESRV